MSNLNDLIHRAVQYSRTNFVSFATASIGTSVLIGYICLSWVERGNKSIYFPHALAVSSVNGTNGDANNLCIDNHDNHDYKGGRGRGRGGDGDGDDDNDNDNDVVSPGTGPGRNPATVMSRDVAVVRAMIENAKNSTWRENIENAACAQDRFALPGREDLWADDNVEKRMKFVERIVERSDEILIQDQQRRRNKEEMDMDMDMDMGINR